MKKTFKENILKWMAESLLIIISVLFAFYLENVRQDSLERNQLIRALHELKESIAVDTLVFQNIAKKNLPRLDTIYRETLTLIKDKEPVNYIIQELYNNDPLNYTNWTVTRMLESDELKGTDRHFKNAIWDYKMKLENLEKGDRSIINENNKKALDVIFSGLKFKEDYSKLQGLGDDQPLVRYRQYRDSSVVYSDQVKGCIFYNLIALQSFRYHLLNHQKDAVQAITLIDQKISELE